MYNYQMISKYGYNGVLKILLRLLYKGRVSLLRYIFNRGRTDLETFVFTMSVHIG